MTSIYDSEWIKQPSQPEALPDKQRALEWVVPQAIYGEMDDMRAEGYEISFGDTYDEAYRNPDLIEDIYNDLEDASNQYEREMGRFELASRALSATRAIAPSKTVGNWAKKKLARRNEKANVLRDKLLYSRLDVQGHAWHDQGGKALALGTIMDAHDLNSRYSSMSGRLTPEILDHTFQGDVGWLAGKTIDEAAAEAKMKFRGKAEVSAREEANREMVKVASFVDAPVRPRFKEVVEYCTDALGIRSRKGETHAEITDHVEASSKDEYLMMSVGCGTALPMLEVIQDLRFKGKNAKLILIDQDPIALAAAQQLAGQMGLEDAIEIRCEALITGRGRKTKVIDLDEKVLQGRKVHISEDSGLREYFPDKLYADLAKQIWESLDDDGLMSTGNMNQNRPQDRFLHGVMGWPIPVRMRKMKDIARLHEEAGVPREATKYRVTQEGVYTMAFSSKRRLVEPSAEYLQAA